MNEQLQTKNAELSARYLPPVEKVFLHLDRSMSGDDLAAAICAKANWVQTRLERAVWHGGLHVNNRRVKPDEWPLNLEGDSRVVVYSFAREPDPVPISATAILHQTSRLCVVNKPAWIAVQGTRASCRVSLEAQLKEYLGCSWLTPAHRLDRQTSGVMVFAFDPEAARFLTQQFERREVQKTYQAWVSPVPDKHKWQVEGFMLQAYHPHHAFFILETQAGQNSRFSLTDFELQEVFGENALILARPFTGRTHQIRVHLKSTQTPVIGDVLYGGSFDFKPARLMLHAQALRLRLPESNQEIELKAPWPEDFAAFSKKAKG